MVTLGAGAAGPVLLAWCQWDPHRLAQKLPQPRRWCVELCATTALASAVPSLCLFGARGRSRGRCRCRLLLPLPSALLSLPHVLAVLCPGLLVRGFREFCALDELGPVALLVCAAFPLYVCMLAHRVFACPLLPLPFFARSSRGPLAARW